MTMSEVYDEEYVKKLCREATDPVCCLHEMQGYIEKWPKCKSGYFSCAVIIMCSTTDEILIKKADAARRFAKSWRWGTPAGRGLAHAYWGAIENRMRELGQLED